MDEGDTARDVAIAGHGHKGRCGLECGYCFMDIEGDMARPKGVQVEVIMD